MHRFLRGGALDVLGRTIDRLRALAIVVALLAAGASHALASVNY